MNKKTSLIIFMIVFYIVWFQIVSPDGDETIGTEPGPSAIETIVQPEAVQGRSFFSMKGLSAEEVLSELGEPVRMDPSGYGYEWWVFETEKGMTQLGIQDGEVVTGVLFHQEEGDIRVGDSYTELKGKFSLETSYPLESEGDYTLQLTEEDLVERPVIRLGSRWTGQVYIDNVTKNIFAIRMIRNDILLKHQPYEVVYRGSLPREEAQSSEDWKTIQKGMESQIFSITNELRKKEGLEELEYHKGAASVAFSHSRDMDENNYFSHVSLNGNGLKERLAEVEYVRAGENIASQYVDATAAVHGWLNSPGHRKALLDPEYTHIGIGVHQRYYTQNFLTVP